MTSTYCRLRVLVVLTGGLFAASESPLQADINLEWRPSLQETSVGEIVEIGLYAVSDDQTDQPVGIIEAILSWNPARLELLGHVDDGPYVWLGSYFPDDSWQDGLNYPYTGVPDNDGDAWYNALAQLPPELPAMATPAGLLVTTFQFEVLSTATTTLAFLPEYGTRTYTRVFGVEPGQDVTGELGPPAVITTSLAPPTPNPMTFATPPYVLDQTSFHMVATTATDLDFPPVEYYFVFVSGGSGGNDSDWQSSPEYTDGDLQTDIQYCYQVMARDSASPPNETDPSSVECAGGAPIPTVSEWGLAIMMMLVLTSGTLVFRRCFVAWSVFEKSP